MVDLKKTFFIHVHFQLSDAIKKENIGAEYRIGLKSLHDLYPSKIHEKITADAKLKTWDAKHKTAVADASRRSSEFDIANTSSNFIFDFEIYLTGSRKN